MKRFKMFISVLITTLVCATSAQAACTQPQVNNKTWKASLFEPSTGTMIFCTVRTTTTGSIIADPVGCDTARVGIDTDYSTTTPFAIVSGSIALVANKTCTYDMTLVIGGSTFKSRVLLGTNKVIANGTWFASGLGGTIAMTKQ